MKKIILAAALALSLPFGFASNAIAATQVGNIEYDASENSYSGLAVTMLTTGEDFITQWSLPAGSTYTADVAFTLNSVSSTVDLSKVLVAVNGDDFVSTWTRAGRTATLLISGLTLTANFFTVAVSNLTTPVTIALTTSVYATPNTIPAVPVPATGLLLLSAVAGIGFVSRRRNKTAA